MALRFDGRVAVVTGAGGGLGRAYALAFAARGAKVVVNDLGVTHSGEGASSRAADLVVSEIKKNGGDAVANYDSVEDGDKIIATAVEAFGKVDILINNAGILRDVSFTKMTDKDWDLIDTVHLKGVYKCTKAAWPHMQKNQYGRIVNVSSAAGIYGNFGQVNYSTAKSGIMGFTKSCALEGKKKNVLSNAIAPVAASRMTETVTPKEVLEKMPPESVIPLVLYLCHESSEATGEIIECGAGWFAAIRVQRAEGVAISKLDPETVKENFEKIIDFGGDVEYPTKPADSVMAAISRSKL
jgi:NAD(P)-dependent dehydrogenase (short-subunit alcohol dehydrogenase family)